MVSNLTLVLALAGLATLCVGGVAYSLLYSRIETEERVGRRLDRIQTQTVSVDPARGRVVDAARRRRSVQDTLKELEEKQKAKSRESNSPPLILRLEQAGLDWSRQTFWIISVMTGVVLAALSWLVGAPLLAVAGIGIAGFLGLPRWFVNFMRKRRMNLFVTHFADAIDVIVRGVKAGLPLNDCIRIIASEAAEPVRSEFRKISESQQALGIPLGDAVGRMPERVPVPEATFFAIVIAIQQKAGGNLAEALGNLSRVLRERRKMKDKITAMSTEAKASAAIIGSLPFAVVIIVYLTSPSYILLLFTHPTGNLILAASLLWMFIGIMVMRKMINFDF